MNSATLYRGPLGSYIVAQGMPIIYSEDIPRAPLNESALRIGDGIDSFEE